MATEQEPKKVDQEEEDEEDLPEQPFSFYLKPDPTFKIISTDWPKFTLLSGVIYTIHLCFLCAGVDKYASFERHIQCGDSDYLVNGKPKELSKITPAEREQASEVFDMWLLLTIVFHLVEWLRQTIFMTSALVGVNLVPVYYVMSLIVPYGFIILLGAGAVGFSAHADCQERQPGRALYLQLQFLAVALLIPTCFAHILFFKIKGVTWVHTIYKKEDDEEEEE